MDPREPVVDMLGVCVTSAQRMRNAAITVTANNVEEATQTNAPDQTRPDTTRPDQTRPRPRPDQARPDQTRPNNTVQHNRPDQIRPDQTRPDQTQTRPDQAIQHKFASSRGTATATDLSMQ